LVVLDPKGTLGGWDLVPWDETAKEKLRAGEPIRTRVVSSSLSMDLDELWLDAMLEVYAAGDCTLYIDEIYSVVPPGSRPSTAMVGIWTRGREFNIGGWATSQRPSWCPLFVLSEADQYFMFRLTVDEDRKRMASFMGEEVRTPIVDKHGFYYSNAEADAPIYVKQLGG
jgi:hypothetical protein